MNLLFLLKLISDLIKTDKPTVEQIQCARKILDSLIEEYDKPDNISQVIPNFNSDLSPEANKARDELR